jgi:hypothetical protein
MEGFTGSHPQGLVGEPQMVNEVLRTRGIVGTLIRRCVGGCVMSELAMLAAGVLVGGAVVVYLLRFLPGTEHWGS